MRVHKLVRAALIAAVYAGLCLALAPLSYGPVQVRVSEALTLLPVLCPEAVVGVTLGCLIANMTTGVPLDMLVGTLATLLAALATRRLRRVRWGGRHSRRAEGLSLTVQDVPGSDKPLSRFPSSLVRGLPVLASLPPVLFNAVIIGAELSWLYLPAGSAPALWLLNMATVGAGQLVSCCGLGLLLVWAIERNPAVLRIVAGDSPPL
ncbi:MAG: QueT transporter family protein [Ruminococcaceae bacterium]|nr:QueT transporter family protein [Oscillospiraceae bacterium]